MDSASREIYPCQDAPRTRRRGVPRASARDGIRIEAAAALLDYVPYRPDVIWIMGQLELFDRGVPTLEMLHTVEELRILPECASDGAQTADMFGMSPSRIVSATIAV